MSRVITIIPARLASTRLPNKPLLDINGKTLIERVYANVRRVIPGEVVVAAGDQAIVDACAGFGAKAILTDPALPSGTDRIAAALREIDPSGAQYDIVVNFQGDAVNVDPSVCNDLVGVVERTGCDIATCGKVFASDAAAENPANVKIVMGLRPGEDEGRALYFTRAKAPFTRNPEKTADQRLFHHIGIYVYKAAALKRFVELPVGVLEERESLEQLRALENGMVIRARLIEDLALNKAAPADIDTEEELMEARKYIF